MVPDGDPLVSSEDSEGCPVAAADPGGAELCSLAPLEVSPLAPVEDLFERSLSAGEPGGAELCSFAPLDVSLPAAGGFADFIVSAAKSGLALSSTSAAALIRYRVMAYSLGFSHVSRTLCDSGCSESPTKACPQDRFSAVPLRPSHGATVVYSFIKRRKSRS